MRIDGSDKKITKKIAIGLLSGGLDSTIAQRVVADQGYHVISVNLETPFCNCGVSNSCTSTRKNVRKDTDFIQVFAGQDYIETVKNPKHGHGKHMNICIDCRLYMLAEAKKIMEEEGADFIFTGEVLGQRPMSQHKRALDMIEKEAGLEGKLLRPLSAKHLKQTDAEKEGRLDREKMLGISGRSRKIQMRMADELGVTDYPQPAGGCKLHDEHFAHLLRDAFAHGEDTMKHINILKFGKHFRSENDVRIISCRDEKENKILRAHTNDDVMCFTIRDNTGTTAYVHGEAGDHEKQLAASIAVYFSKMRGAEEAAVKCWMGRDGEEEADSIMIKPFTFDEIFEYKI